MRSLAGVLDSAGWRVTGSDSNSSLTSPWHATSDLAAGADVVVHSPAVPLDNPELVAARRQNLPIVSYPAMLGRLMADHFGVAVAGTHGKSTTTAMAAEILLADGLDPTVVFGASPLGGSSGGRFGRGDIVLAEACEYRDSFLHLRPRVAAILGIEPDHFDYFRSARQLDASFERFARQVPADGIVLVSDQCNRARRIMMNLDCRRESFGFSETADWQARVVDVDCGRHRFEIWHRGQRMCEAALQVPGLHQVSNALAAAAVARHCGASADAICSGLASFRGLQRRLESLGEAGGVAIVDDYAHHPTEIAASLAAVRMAYPGRRVWCVFQPHQVSRTAHLLDDLAASLHNADTVLVADIFRAREGSPQPGEVTAADLARRARARGAAVLDVHSTQAIVACVQEGLRPGDVLVTMGAGDIGKIVHGIRERL